MKKLVITSGRLKTDFRSFWFSVGIALVTVSAQAAFIVQVDTDGNSGNAAVTLNSHVTFGNGMTGGFGASTHATAVGLQPGNSIFGGNSPTNDQYIFTYTPGVDFDNFLPAPGTALGNGLFASGEVGGGSGLYNVFAAWPNTANISDNGAVPTEYVAASDTGNVTTGLNQDEDTNGGLVGGVWAYIGQVQLTAGNSYTVTQTAPNSSFVSMRAEAIMWEPVPVPEPAAMSLMSIVGAILMLMRRARRA